MQNYTCKRDVRGMPKNWAKGIMMEKEVTEIKKESQVYYKYNNRNKNICQIGQGAKWILMMIDFLYFENKPRSLLRI